MAQAGIGDLHKSLGFRAERGERLPLWYQWARRRAQPTVPIESVAGTAITSPCLQAVLPS